MKLSWKQRTSLVLALAVSLCTGVEVIWICSTLSKCAHAADVTAVDEKDCSCQTQGQGAHYGISPASVAPWESNLDATATHITKEWMEPTGFPKLNAEEAMRHLAKVGCLTEASVNQSPQL